MEKEEKNQRLHKSADPDYFLQWGNTKRLRCVRVRGTEISDPSGAGGRVRRRITSRVFATASEKESSFLLQPTRHTRNSEAAALRSDNRRSGSGSPEEEEEERYYGRRGTGDENGKGSMEGGERGGGGGGGGGDEKRGAVWPKLYISLSSKEKEEDFMAMKGCKPPQRPKKRAKIIQRTLLLVSPGAWLSDMCQERYEVREKKSSKKRPRGLKAMGSIESDSE